MKINIAELKKVLKLQDGKLYRRLKNGWREVKNVPNQGRYCAVKYDDRLHRYHRIVWLLYTGINIPAGYEIDHINGDRLCSYPENLRLVTSRENHCNLASHRFGRLPGAHYHKRNRRWSAALEINCKAVHLGYYDTEKQAHNAYKKGVSLIPEYKDNEQFRELIRGSYED